MKNQVLIEAYDALVAVNRLSLPPLVSIRLGRNMVALRPIVLNLESKQRQLASDLRVAPEFTAEPDFATRMAEFNKGTQAILDDEDPWVPVITIPFAMVENAKEFSNAAQLVAAGILVE